MREAIKAADLVLIPTRPRAFDLHALEGIADMVNFTGTPAHVLLNGVPARATKMVEEAKATVAEMGLETCPIMFGERADFHRSSSKGEVASEIDPDGKAAGEVKALYKWVKKALT